MVISDKKANKLTIPNSTAAFRWGYIVLPIIILLLSLVLTAIFYPRLPVDLAYHFKGDGSPDRWLNRNQVILVMLIPQLLLTLVAGSTTWGVAKMSGGPLTPQQTEIKKRIIVLMGNMMALPQIVLGFAMLDIYIYAAYRIHLMPLWVFAVIVMVAGAIVLGIFFIRAFRETRRATQ
jgi:uncharacterized membrane protein